MLPLFIRTSVRRRSIRERVLLGLDSHFRCCSFELGEDTFTHGAGGERALTGDKSLVGEAEDVQFVFLESPLPDVMESSVDELRELALAEAFKQRAHLTSSPR